MRTLLLLRHGKSSWDEPGLADFERPLAPRGRRAAAAIGRYLRASGPLPDLVLCSAARRARETWTIAAAELGHAPRRRTERGLYLAAPDRLLARLRRCPEAAETVLLIGHNPGLASLAVGLAGTGEAEALARLRRKLPTGALAILRFDLQRWADLAEGGGQLERLVLPRALE